MMALSSLVLPLLRLLPAERAHEITLRALKAGIAPARAPVDDPALATRLWGLDFPNPIGLAAGFDKNAEVPDAMLRWGIGFTEIGTVTPRPQQGNPLPRLFRLTEDGAVINRMGFNNEGLGIVTARLTARPRRGIVGANLGKNRDAVDATADYCRCVTTLAPLTDYLVVNISSPNTPGLRDLQRRSEVGALIHAVVEARNSVGLDQPPPMLLKIAPDLTPQEIDDIAEVALDSKIDGIIVSNTTVARLPTLRSANAPEPGGLSGKPLFEPSTLVLAEIYRRTDGRIPLVGVGGIASGADAYAKIRAGASLLQLYSALVYQGPALIGRIKRDLIACLKRDGFANIAEAVGSGNNRVAMGMDRQGA
jgi:dihydroorotate dehydrogenase